jgi:small subunit ribosomal protein S11
MINAKQIGKNLNVISLQCTSNNTIGSLIDSQGKLITTLSSGHLKYKGSRKGTQIASQQVIYYLGEKALELGYERVLVKIKGIGKGRNSAIKELRKSGLQLIKVIDSTLVAYNGCRLAKGKK